MTITEGLAEIKTLVKRIEKKREFVLTYLWRQEGNKDPLEKDGGSSKAIAEARQAITDLESRIVAIRGAITEANRTTDLNVCGRTMSIYDWLTWRREVSAGAKDFIRSIQTGLRQIRTQAAQKQIMVVEGRGENLSDIVVNVSESAIADEAERMEETLGNLDGLLSLKNATVTISV